MTALTYNDCDLITKGINFLNEYKSYVERIMKSYELENMLAVAQNDYNRCCDELDYYGKNLIYPISTEANNELTFKINKKLVAERKWNSLIASTYNNECFSNLNNGNIFATKMKFMDALYAHDITESVKNYIKEMVETEEKRLSSIISGGSLIEG